MSTVKEVEPKVREIEGLYLRFDLQKVAQKLDGPLVFANYICDQNDVIAKKDDNDGFQVPKELKNAPDWRLFQELTAQSDVIITGSGYLQRFAKMGAKAQDVINQFSKGAEFSSLGDWRVSHGLKRNPDIAVISRSLDFEIPEAAFMDGRKVLVFTTRIGASSEKAGQYKKLGAEVIEAGEDGVDGTITIDTLSSRGYKVIKNTTGPRVLDILLRSNVLNGIFITRVQKDIAKGNTEVQTVLHNKKLENLEGFSYKRLFYLEEVKASDGHIISEEFGIYNKDSNSISIVE